MSLLWCWCFVGLDICSCTCSTFSWSNCPIFDPGWNSGAASWRDLLSTWPGCVPREWRDQFPQFKVPQHPSAQVRSAHNICAWECWMGKQDSLPLTHPNGRQLMFFIISASVLSSAITKNTFLALGLSGKCFSTCSTTSSSNFDDVLHQELHVVNTDDQFCIHRNYIVVLFSNLWNNLELSIPEPQVFKDENKSIKNSSCLFHEHPHCVLSQPCKFYELSSWLSHESCFYSLCVTSWIWHFHVNSSCAKIFEEASLTSCACYLINFRARQAINLNTWLTMA